MPSPSTNGPTAKSPKKALKATASNSGMENGESPSGPSNGVYPHFESDASRHRSLPGTTNPQSTLAYFWDLASVDPNVRLTAAVSLITALSAMQADHDRNRAEDSEDDAELDTDTQDIDVVCHQDVAYALKRLLRGLSSSRNGAREGFALVLTELLRMLSFLRVSTVLDLLDSLTLSSKGFKGQEEREMLFARIFCFRSILLSEMLLRPHTTPASTARIAKYLLECAAEKTYLQEASFEILIGIFEQKVSRGGSDEAVAIVKETLTGGIATVEHLWLAVVAQQAFSECKLKFNWESLLGEEWERSDPLLHPANRERLGDLLKDTSLVCPRLHSVWFALREIVCSQNSPIPLQEFWNHFVDSTLFSSTVERKFVGLRVFEEFLSGVGKKQIPYIFSENLLKCLISNLRSADSLLKSTAKSIVKKITTIARKRNEVSLQIALQLIGKRGNIKFDQITGTKTVEKLIESLDEAQVDTYVDHLIETFIKQATNKDEDAVDGEPSLVDSHRLWAVDQMLLLTRNTKIPKSRSSLAKVVKFLSAHAFFAVNATDSALLLSPPTPPVSPNIREQLQARLASALSDLVRADLDKRESAEKKKATQEQMWFYVAVKHIADIEKSKAAQLVVQLSEEAIQAKSEAWKLVAGIRNRVSAIDVKSDVHLIPQLVSMEILFLYVILQAYSDEESATQVFGDIEQCYLRLLPESSVEPKRKRKADSEEPDDEAPEAIEVLVDTALSILSNSSVLGRTLGENVFRAFCSRMTPAAITLLFEIIFTGEGSAGAEELFEDAQEVIDGEEDAAEEPAKANGVEKSQSKNVEDGEGDAGREDGHDHDDDDDDDDNDDDDDEDDDDDDDDDAESEASEVPEEFRQKIMEALGEQAPEADDGNNSDESEFFDDDQMAVFDDKLAEIFAERKAKVARKGVNLQALQFKQRVVDLLDIFVLRQPEHPVIIDMLVPSLKVAIDTSFQKDANQLHNKIASFISSRLAKVKESPKCTAETGLAVLSEIHAMARKAPAPKFVGLCSALSLVVIRSLAKYCPADSVEPPAGASTERSSPAKKAKKAKTDKPADTGVDSTKGEGLSPVASAYAASLREYMKHRKSRLRPSLFLDLAKKHPTIALELFPAVAEILSEKSGVVQKGHRVSQSFDLMSTVFQNLPAKSDDAALLARVREAIRLLGQILVRVVGGAVSSKDKGVSPEELKDTLKATNTAVRHAKKWLGAEISEAVNQASLSKALQQLETKPELSKPSIKNLVKVIDDALTKR